MTAYLKEPTPSVEAAARALFQRWKDRSAQSIIPPQPGSYVLDPWENLPPSVKGSFYFDAEAALKAAAATHRAEDEVPEGELPDAEYLEDLAGRIMHMADADRLYAMSEKLKTRRAPISAAVDADKTIRDALTAALAIVADRAAGGRMLTTKEGAKAAMAKITAVLGSRGKEAGA